MTAVKQIYGEKILIQVYIWSYLKVFVEHLSGLLDLTVYVSLGFSVL